MEEINKANLLWGFNGVNGQGFFNLIAEASSAAKLHSELNYLFKEILPAPVNPEFTVHNIRTFINFLLKLSTASGDERVAPKAGSIPSLSLLFLAGPETGGLADLLHGHGQ